MGVVYLVQAGPSRGNEAQLHSWAIPLYLLPKLFCQVNRPAVEEVKDFRVPDETVFLPLLTCPPPDTL